MPVVADASFVAAILIEEEHTGYARAILPDLVVDGLTAPALILWEMTNIFRNQRRRGLLGPEDVTAVQDIFLAMPLELETDPRVMPATLVLADARSLTAYDAAYLEMALRLDAPLATLDKALAFAARAEGLVVHSPFA